MIHPVFIGCDISKTHLDLFDSRTQTHLRIPNTPAAIDAWLNASQGPQTTSKRLVPRIIESEGGFAYDRSFRNAMRQTIRLIATTDAPSVAAKVASAQSLPSGH